MKMKKFLALLLAGMLTFSMSMVAFASDEIVTLDTGDGDNEEEDQNTPSGGSCTTTTEKKSPTKEEIQAAKERAEARAIAAADAVVSEANAIAAEELGLPMATLQAAAETGKNVGEFFNNAVTETPGLEDATPVAQGGGVIIDGVASNQSFTISKPVAAQVDSAKAQAAALNGTVLNVVDVDGAVFFENASVNFYMPGVTGAENIQVLQLADGQWTPVAVAEVRADHVVVNMTDYGVLAFVQVQ